MRNRDGDPLGFCVLDVHESTFVFDKILFEHILEIDLFCWRQKYNFRGTVT